MLQHNGWLTRFKQDRSMLWCHTYKLVINCHIASTQIAWPARPVSCPLVLCWPSIDMYLLCATNTSSSDIFYTSTSLPILILLAALIMLSITV